MTPLPAGLLRGGNRYVPPTGNIFVSPTGSDSNLGTFASPFATIHKGASVANAGDVIMVEDGTWTDTHGTELAVAELARNGSAGNPITLCARSLYGAKVSGSGGAKIGFSFQGAVTNWVVEGFEFFGLTSTSGSACGIECFSGGANSLLRFNHIHDIGRICTLNGQGQDGIFIERNNITVEQNIIHDIGRLRPEEGGSCYGGSLIYQSNDHGIYCDDGDNTLIRNNVFYNCKSGWAIQLYSHDHVNMRILNNTFAYGNPDRHYSFILFGVPETSCLISNNVFYDPVAGEPLHYLFLSGTATMSYNITTGAAMVDQVNGAMTFSNNLLSTNALLVNPPTDMKLQAGSPAINAGQTLSDVTTDFNGVTRPVGAAYDMGAYER